MAPQKTMSFLKKITVKECKLNTRDLEKIAIEESPKEIAILRVAGICTDIKPGTSTISQYKRFIGAFEAINLLSGATYRATDMILPTVAEQFVSKAVESARKTLGDKLPEVDNVRGVTVALDVTVIENKSSFDSGFKFKYGVSPLSNIEGKDAIGELMESFGPAPVYLPDKTGKKKS